MILTWGRKFGRGTWRLVYRATQEFLRDDCTRAAAALAYYTLFAMAPLLTLVVGAASLFVEPSQIQGEVAAQLESVIGAQGVATVQKMVDSRQANATSWIAGAMSIGMLLMGATGMFGQIQAALNQAWGVMPDPRERHVKKLIWKRVLSVGLILVISLTLLASVLASALLAVLGNSLGEWIGQSSSHLGVRLANGLMSLAVITLLFGLTFRLLPDAKVQWRDVWVGAGVTAVLFTLGKMLLAYYFHYAKIGSSFGAAGSLVLLLAFIYYASMIFLWGAEFTQMWAGQRGRQIHPRPGAIRVSNKPFEETPARSKK
ncbi:YihY/virulence factor BrkB family protein [Lignipirellula cremea]|nr:YihY/virulence factor BrkB family protein [Lignipirellula cremea]